MRTSTLPYIIGNISSKIISQAVAEFQEFVDNQWKIEQSGSPLNK